MSQQNKVSYAVIPGIRISEKNLLPVFDIIVPSGNGITYERNGDGSVHVYGTAADSSYCEIVNSGKKFILPAGTYTMNMGNATYPAGITISANAYNQDFSYNKYYGDIGSWASQCTFDAVEGTYFSLIITINAGTTIDITLYPQLEAGSVATEYEPYEIIEGFTQKIKKKYLVIDGVTRKLTKKYSCVPKLVGYSEKNLLPKSRNSTVNAGITYTLNADGSIHAHGTATGVSYHNIVNKNNPISLPSGEYNISPGVNLNIGYIAICNVDGNTILASSATVASGKNTRFTILEETQVYIYLRFPANAVVDAVIYPQLERGSVATEYEPYEIWKSFTRLVYSATEDISAAEITLASGTLTYNGSSQTKKVSSVVLNGKTLAEGTDYTVSGNTGINAGSYTLTITGIGDYEGTATAAWSIAKATGKISVSPTTLDILGPAGTTATATITYTGDGSISVKSGSTGVATVTRSGNTVTVESVSDGSATITITLTAGTNYTGASCTISVVTRNPVLTYIGNTTNLGSARAYIAQTSFAGNAMFAGGFTGTSTWNGNTVIDPGTISTIDLYNSSGTRTSTELSEKKYEVAAASTNAHAVFLGGDTNSSKNASSYTSLKAEEFNSSFTRTVHSMPERLMSMAAGALGDTIIYSGGIYSGVMRDSVGAYDPSMTRIDLTALTSSRYNHGAGQVGENLLFAGGGSSNGTVATVNAYSPELTRLSGITNLAKAMDSVKAAKFGIYTIFVGRTTTTDTHAYTIYDSSMTRVKSGTFSGTGALINVASTSERAIVGGFESRNTVDVFDESLTISNMDGLNPSRSYVAAAGVGNTVFFAGGYIANEFNNPSNVVDMFSMT